MWTGVVCLDVVVIDGRMAGVGAEGAGEVAGLNDTRTQIGGSLDGSNVSAVDSRVNSLQPGVRSWLIGCHTPAVALHHAKCRGAIRHLVSVPSTL